VLVATPRFAPDIGGAETWTREVTAALAARGYRLRVVARWRAGLPPRHLEGEIEVLRIPGGRARFAAEVARAVRGGGADVVLAQYAALPPAIVTARSRKVPVLAVVHDVYGFAESVRLRGAVLGSARHVALERSLWVVPPDGYLVPSRATATSVRPLARGRPVWVVPSGADHVRPSPEAVQPDPDRVVFVGRLVPSKGVQDMLEACRLLRAGRGRRVRALVVGTGPAEPRLRRLAAGSGQEVRFVPSLADGALQRAVRGSAALVLPSVREGWGLVLSEAAALGVPYVAYDIPAVREQHELLGGGLLVPPSAAALADGMDALLADPQMAAALGAAGARAARGRTWAQAGEVVDAAIRELLEDGP
jgi:glycosyltransferase involved in cell wall biosynthesis